MPDEDKIKVIILITLALTIIMLLVGLSVSGQETIVKKDSVIVIRHAYNNHLRCVDTMYIGQYVKILKIKRGYYKIKYYSPKRKDPFKYSIGWIRKSYLL